MNKKLGIILVFVLLVGTVFLSACEQPVGSKLSKSVSEEVYVTYAMGEISIYKENMKKQGENPDDFVFFRKSTNNELRPSTSIIVVPREDINIVDLKNGGFDIEYVGDNPEENPRVFATNSDTCDDYYGSPAHYGDFYSRWTGKTEHGWHYI